MGAAGAGSAAEAVGAAGAAAKAAGAKAGRHVARRAGGAASATHGAAKNVVRGRSTSPAQAKGVVVFALVVAGGAVALSDFKAGHTPDLKLGVGIIFGGVLLSALADLMPEIVAPMALLVIVGVLLTPRNGRSPGQDIIESVRRIAPSK